MSETSLADDDVLRDVLRSAQRKLLAGERLSGIEDLAIKLYLRECFIRFIRRNK